MPTQTPETDDKPTASPTFKISLDWWAVIVALFFAVLILLNVITVSW